LLIRDVLPEPISSLPCSGYPWRLDPLRPIMVADYALHHRGEPILTLTGGRKASEIGGMSPTSGQKRFFQR